VYGVVSHAVGRRTAEIGVRMALGAQRREVLGMVMRQGLAFIACGLGVGLLTATFAARAMGGLLYGISPVDAPTFLAVAALLALIVTLAVLPPALRASRVSPVDALRSR